MSDDFQDVYDPSFVIPGSQGDDALHVEFFTDPITNDEMIRINIPADKHLQPIYLADDQSHGTITYKQRFHKEYQAFKSGREQHDGQLFLDKVGWITPAHKAQLNMVGVFTLEGLANVSDSNLENLPAGGRKMVEKAQQELADRAKTKAFDEQQKELNELRAQLTKIQQAQAAQVEVQKPSQSEPVKGRGRPAKQVEAA